MSLILLEQCDQLIKIFLMAKWRSSLKASDFETVDVSSSKLMWESMRFCQGIHSLRLSFRHPPNQSLHLCLVH